MERAYAAMLGLTAFAVVTLRGAIRGDLPVDTMPSGITALLAFGVIGYLAGSTCDRLVKQAVEQRFRESVKRIGEALSKDHGGSE